MSISGAAFNKIYRDTMVRLTREGEKHHEHQYITGLNVDRLTFNPSGECSPGGLYFCTLAAVQNWRDNHVYLRWVTIPDDAQVYVMDDQFKCDKFILSERESIVNALARNVRRSNLCRDTPYIGAEFNHIVAETTLTFVQLAAAAGVDKERSADQAFYSIHEIPFHIHGETAAHLVKIPADAEIKTVGQHFVADWLEFSTSISLEALFKPRAMLLEQLVRRHPSFILHVKPTRYLAKLVVLANHLAIRNLNLDGCGDHDNSFKTDLLAMAVASNRQAIIDYRDSDYAGLTQRQVYQVYFAAVSAEGYNLRYVNKRLITPGYYYELCHAAMIRDKAKAQQYIDKSILTSQQYANVLSGKMDDEPISASPATKQASPIVIRRTPSRSASPTREGYTPLTAADAASSEHTGMKMTADAPTFTPKTDVPTTEEKTGFINKFASMFGM